MIDKKKRKEKEELLTKNPSNDPILKEVIEYENERGEELIKDISPSELAQK